MKSAISQILRLSKLLLVIGWAIPSAVLALDPPTGVDWISDSESSVVLSWTNSAPGALVDFEFTRGEAVTKPGYTVGVEMQRWTNILDGDQFRLRTITLSESGQVVDASPYTDPIVIQLRTDLSISNRRCVIEAPGQFEYPLELGGFVFSEISVSGAPAGLVLTDSPPRLAGPVTSGNYSMVISGVTGKHRRSVNLELIITSAPQVASPVGNLSGTVTAPNSTIDLTGVFIDPDAGTIVRMNTVMGPVDIALYDDVAPLTVASFLSYVDRGALDGTFVHNVSTGSFSILQAGQFIPREDEKLQRVAIDPSASPEDFDASRSNVCGTIAMLKPTGDAATNQWLFNFSDNSSALDRYYGAFGRVMGDGMSVVNAIASLPVTSAYSATVVTCAGVPPNEICNEAPLAFKDWPLLRIREGGLDTDDLVTMSTVARIEPMTFALISNSAPSVASVDVSEAGEMVIDYLAQGQAEIEVGATDRDGVTTSHVFTISVGETFEGWAALAGLAGGDALATANPDHDTFSNLLEYAFGANPAKADSEARGVSVPQGADKVPAITFFYRPSAVDLDYAVQLGDDLAGEWSEVWNSSLGLDHSAVVSEEEMGDGILKVTVGAANAELPAFLRVHVSNL
ncbi:MAG: peptidylprolyl isomerase [Verrucomicrobiales bacterium]